MTPEEKEKFYDEEIAPILAQLGKKCEDNGLSFFAAVEYDPEEYGFGRTSTRTKDCSVVMEMLNWVAKSMGNIDAFVMAAARYTIENKLPHSSIVLSQYTDPNPGKRK
jgi:hypothetical protein